MLLKKDKALSAGKHHESKMEIYANNMARLLHCTSSGCSIIRNKRANQHAEYTASAEFFCTEFDFFFFLFF